jgi:hypothetical protein
MSTESLLHYNECAADSGAPCTCEPPLTTVEEVAAVLFGCHVLEFIDAETGWACGCDEDGYLELLTLEVARKHQAESMVAAVAPVLNVQSFQVAARLLRGHGLDEAAAWMDYYVDHPNDMRSAFAGES